MSIKDLSEQDFSWLKKKASNMRQMHEDRFMREIQPELMGALYRGYKSTEYKMLTDRKDLEQLKRHVLTYSRIFTACNTIIPNLQYQMPRVLAIPEHGTDPESAATMTAYLNNFHRVSKQKKENQQAVINSFFLGISWKKIGFNHGQPDQVTGSRLQNYIKPGLFNTFESPVNVYLDDKGTYNSFKAIVHSVPRSLEDLYTFNYDAEVIDRIKEEYEKKNGSKYDARDVKFDLNEMIIEGKDGCYMMVYVEQHSKEPLYFDKMDIECVGDVWKPLVFTNEPDSMYPTSHLGVASRVQTWIDEVASKYIEMIGRSRRGHIINQNLLAPGQTKEGFLKNLIGGVLWTSRPATSGDVQEVVSSPIQADYGAVLAMLQQNVGEILGSDAQQISGDSNNKTLGQDKIAAIGTQLRESGILDKVGDWINDQCYTEGNLAQKYDSSSFKLFVEPTDFQDQEVAQGMNPTQLEFGTPNQPLPMNYMMQDCKFKYQINVYEAVKPDKKALAAEYDQFMLQYSNPMVQGALMKNDVLPRLDLVAEERAGLFEYMDGKRFLQKLTSMQKTSLQMQQIMMNGGQQQAQAPSPASQPKQSSSPTLQAAGV